ncbi:MAG: hypothetical protein AB1552_12575, partial [Nitrospirota bacterium]
REYRVYSVHGLFLLAGIGFGHHYFPTSIKNRPIFINIYRTLMKVYTKSLKCKIVFFIGVVVKFKKFAP